ncbi:MAG: VanW family protein [Acidimicrobiales bacterium]
MARIAELTRKRGHRAGDHLLGQRLRGRRTTDNGFVAAGVISNGVFSESVGGGISQYATTLFNAAFFAGLEFGEYQSHSIYIDRYPYGREATVSFPHPDLQIRNPSPYGVLIWPTTTDDSITVRLYSTRWAVGDQTGQKQRTEGTSCTRVTTERTRTFVGDGHTEVDTVTARYRPEGVACDGSSTRPTTAPSTTDVPTTVP